MFENNNFCLNFFFISFTVMNEDCNRILYLGTCYKMLQTHLFAKNPEKKKSEALAHSLNFLMFLSSSSLRYHKNFCLKRCFCFIVSRLVFIHFYYTDLKIKIKMEFFFSFYCQVEFSFAHSAVCIGIGITINAKTFT